MNAKLAQASRAARDSFRGTSQKVFEAVTSRAEFLGKHFAVPIRDKFVAELDVQGSVVTSGGVALHDAQLPLRTLGTGSSRLLVSALQHDARGSHIALVDEIEHGLEPHRIARLLKYLRGQPLDEKGEPSKEKTVRVSQQIFMTTHSPVVIREIDAKDIHTVRSINGKTEVRSVVAMAKDIDVAQRHLRSSPDAFLARRVLIGEGKTECGLVRGLDVCWTQGGKDSLAYHGVIPINGEGIPKALIIAEHLLDLGYGVFVLLDSDEPPSDAQIAAVKAKGGVVVMWAGKCSTDERMFLDVPWDTVQALVRYAVEIRRSEESVLATINNACKSAKVDEIHDLSLPPELNNPTFREVLGLVAKRKEWFKDIARGEHLAHLVFGCLDKITESSFAKVIMQARKWVDDDD